MADIVKKIGKITRYETKTYVGAQKILDLDLASATPSQLPPPASVSQAPPPPAPPEGAKEGTG
jgi:hypothetical protein